MHGKCLILILLCLPSSQKSTAASLELLLLPRSPATSLGFTILGEILAYMTVFCVFFFFFYPTIEIVTFHVRGWCMLGVFGLPAFIRLGHERQDLLSPCDGLHV